MNLFKTLILIIFCFCAGNVVAQKKLLKKANSYYKLNQYKDAIVLYEEAIQEKESLSAATKLAYCYRMTNQMIKAEAWYAKVVADEKARPITYYYYAESLMSNEKYDLAKNWFLKYNEKKPDDKNAIRMAYACDKVKTLEPYFKNLELSTFEHNTDADDSSPLSFNNGVVFTSDRSSGVNPLKQKSGWTGRDYQRIYFSSDLGNNKFDKPGNFSKKLNDLNKHCGPVSFTEDGKMVIFTRSGQEAAKDNSYNIQLYSAESEDGKKWKNVKLLSFCSREHNYMHPSISPNGERLFFVSDKPGGLGGTDIYMSLRKGDGWAKPVNLGPIINTPVNEAFPYYHSSDKLFFCSKGHLSFGGFDILFSNLKEDGSWQKPVNVGKPINSSYDDISISLNATMDAGMFASSRDGGDDDIYLFRVTDGINTTLDTLDFDGEGSWIVNRESETEVAPTTPSSLTEEMPTPEETKEIIEERPITNIAPTVRENVELEEVREVEKEVVDIVKTENVSNEIAEELSPSNQTSTDVSDLIIEAEVPETTSEPVVRSMPVETSLPNRKEEITETVMPEVQAPISEVQEPIKEAPELVMEETTKAEKVKNKSKKINLLIPSKKKKKDLSSSVTEEEIVIQETVTPISKEINPQPVNKEPIMDSELPSKKMDSPVPTIDLEVAEEKINEAPAILDRESAESTTPVLMGTETSMLAQTPEMLPRLAEFLQTKQAVNNKRFIISGITYPRGSYLLSPEGTRSLTALVDLLNMYPEIKIEVGSHTAAPGDDVDNHNLSRKRAMSIMAFLIYKGIANDRITAKGYGETQLLNECANGVDCPKLAHKENDRIEVRVVE